MTIPALPLRRALAVAALPAGLVLLPVERPMLSRAVLVSCLSTTRGQRSASFEAVA